MRTKTDIKIVNEFTDDHILCCRVKYMENDKVRKRKIMWCGWEGLAACKYANDSDAAYANFEKILGHNICIL